MGAARNIFSLDPSTISWGGEDPTQENAALTGRHKKELLFKHIRENEGPKLHELSQVLPELTKHQVQNLLRELKKRKPH